MQSTRSNASQLRDQTAGEEVLERSDMELDVGAGIQSRPPEMRNGECKAEMQIVAGIIIKKIGARSKGSREATRLALQSFRVGK